MCVASLFAACEAPAVERADSAEARTRTLEEAWYASLVRAESLLSLSSMQAGNEDDAGVAVTEQVRIGVHVLGSALEASVAADTLLAAPLATMPHPGPAAGGWRRISLGATRLVTTAASLGQLLIGSRGGSPRARSVLGWVAGSAAVLGSVLHRWIARSPTGQSADANVCMYALDLESDLRASIHETERSAESLWSELRGMALDSCATREQVVRLARRYANVLQEASVVIDSRVARSRTIARSCAACPGLNEDSRERCEALASHLEAVGAQWQERTWLIERSKRNTLDYLILADRP
jgi:hypothetical protein